MTALLTVTNLKKHFPIRKGFFGRKVGDVRALDGVSLTINAGETLGLVGESGCGKSTLGRTILRLLPATEGSVVFENTNVLTADKKTLKTLRRNLQIVFQNPYASLDPRMTVFDIVAEPLVVHQRLSKSELKVRVFELL